MDKIVLKESAQDPQKLYKLIEITFGNKYQFHEDFVPEFVELISKSGSEVKLLKQLMGRLRMIIELDDIDCGLKWLEKLKAYDNMYSLHLDADSKNYRILFSKNEKGKLFLHMFYEKDGKTNTSYEKHVPLAISRRDGTT